jgi:glycosyltransferase involved in cell wall biosynthesis
MHFYCNKIKTDISIIPEWFYDEFSIECNENIDVLKEVKTDNNLLIIGQLCKINPEIDRKNILKTLETAINSVRGSNWGIVLKMFTENNSYYDFLKTKKILKTYIDINFKHVELPKIYLIHGNMKSKELKSLYNNDKIKCLVSGTKGEGFGLTFLEAAASGLPIVATKWSAYDEYLEYYLGIDFDLEKIPVSLSNVNNEFEIYSHIWVENSLWAEFNKNSMEKNIKKVINKEYNVNRVLQQQKSILNKYSKNSIMSIYNKQFGR